MIVSINRLQEFCLDLSVQVFRRKNEENKKDRIKLNSTQWSFQDLEMRSKLKKCRFLRSSRLPDQELNFERNLKLDLVMQLSLETWNIFETKRQVGSEEKRKP